MRPSLWRDLENPLPDARFLAITLTQAAGFGGFICFLGASTARRCQINTETKIKP